MEVGISHLTSPPHTPVHNGIAERKHRHIIETRLTLLTHFEMPKKYWPFTLATATYLINQLQTPVLNMDSPYHKLFQTQPKYLKIRVYGCLCFPWLRPYNAHKMEDKSMPCVFLGYSRSQSVYLCLNKSSCRIYVSRHVTFDETNFPFKTKTRSPTPTSQETKPSHLQSPPLTLIPIHKTLITQPPFVQPTGTTSLTPLLQVHEISTATERTTAPTDVLPETTPTPQAVLPQQKQLSTTSQQLPSSATTKPAVAVSAPTNAEAPPNQHPMVTHRKNQISKPNSIYNYMAAMSSIILAEPNTLKQALQDKRWRGSISSEIDVFARNDTFELVSRLHNHNMIDCRWLYTNKFFSNGSHKCCKSRLVANGYNQ